MIRLFLKTSILLFIFLTMGCGFKVLNETQNNNFFIKDIIVSGDKRINFKIKNNLLTYSKENSQNEILINFNSRKEKNTKEKNIKNEVTKYQINLTVNLTVKLLNTGEEVTLSTSNNGDYLVAESYATTLDNEKKLINDLIENSSEEIVKKINLKLDDI
tara:strand:- start:81 stop:557 length:477 start_codon:yes stop_codon:yes gene_type:complete